MTFIINRGSHNGGIGSDGCFANLSISDTASDNESVVLWMNYWRRSTRHTIARWKKSAIKTGNTHAGSSSALQ